MNRKPALRTRLVTGLLTLLFAIVAIAQGDWSLGRYRLLTRRPSPPLEFNTLESGGLGSYSFVSSVGGVAFAGVASPGNALQGRPTRLVYNAASEDGHRLQVNVGDEVLSADLADWMLVPIVNFSDSRFDSCVSLFGPRTTESEYDIVYHAALQNTLLGLRLLQSDMLLFDLNETWRLPQLGNVAVLGLGEVAPRSMNDAGARQISAALEAGDFQSWVMTDQGESIVANAQNGRLTLSGSPYYHFWTSDVNAVIARQNDLEGRAASALRSNNVAEHNRIIDEANALVPQVFAVDALTARLRVQREALMRFNAAVYGAATNTMRYAAFFRYVKQQNPSGWKDFVARVAGVELRPTVQTPTSWAR